jgi:HlyD family secretion protein
MLNTGFLETTRTTSPRKTLIFPVEDGQSARTKSLTAQHVEVMIIPKVKTALFALVFFSTQITSLTISGAITNAQAQARAGAMNSTEEQHWLASASGRVEPSSGMIKVGTPALGIIDEVLVKANDKVFAGEPLIRLVDREAQARLAAATAAVAMRKRLRNKESASSSATARRKAEDAVADAEAAVSEAQSSVDKAAIEKRAGRGSDSGVEAARSGLARAQDRLRLQRNELRRIEVDASLPTTAEGQLNIARSELLVAQVAMDKMTIRASTSGTILQINARPGELASPSTAQPLVLLGDVSSLRVRALVDERDIGKVKVGQPVLVRPAAFPGREIAGSVSFIAPLVEAERADPSGQQSKTDVAEVLVDLSESASLAVGMNVDVYFRQDTASH